jgi:hypothetical protein
VPHQYDVHANAAGTAKHMSPAGLRRYRRWTLSAVVRTAYFALNCSGSMALVALLNQKAAGWSAARTLLLLDDAYQAEQAPLIATSTNRRRHKADTVDSADRSVSLRVLDVDGDGALDVIVSVRPTHTPRQARVPIPIECVPRASMPQSFGRTHRWETIWARVVWPLAGVLSLAALRRSHASAKSPSHGSIQQHTPTATM